MAISFTPLLYTPHIQPISKSVSFTFFKTYPESDHFTSVLQLPVYIKPLLSLVWIIEMPSDWSDDFYIWPLILKIAVRVVLLKNTRPYHTSAQSPPVLSISFKVNTKFITVTYETISIIPSLPHLYLCSHPLFLSTTIPTNIQNSGILH